MKPGSVIVDMAARALGGNVELSQARRDRRHRQRRDDHRARPTCRPRCRRAPEPFYARNISALLLHFVKDGALTSTSADEITGGDRDHPRRRGRPGGDASKLARAALRPPEVPHEPRSCSTRSRSSCWHPGRLRGHQQGPGDAAHAADVGRQLDPRHRAGRRDAHRRRGGQPARATCSPSSPWSSARPTSSAATSSPTGCSRCSGRSRGRQGRAAPALRHGGQVSRCSGAGSTPSSSSPGSSAPPCFVLGLHQMNSPATARRGNQLSAAGMALAVVATLALAGHSGPGRPERSRPGRSSSSASLVGGGVGLYMARSREDDRDAAAGVAVQRGRRRRGRAGRDRRLHPHRRARPSVAVDRDLRGPGAVIGSVTFSGSLIAGGKLQGLIPGSRSSFPGARLVDLRPGRHRGRRARRPAYSARRARSR